MTRSNCSSDCTVINSILFHVWRLNSYKSSYKVGLVQYSLMSTGLGTDPVFLAVSHKPGCRLPLPSTRPTVTFPAKEITPCWPIPNYTAWWQRHTGVSITPVCLCDQYSVVYKYHYRRHYICHRFINCMTKKIFSKTASHATVLLCHIRFKNS